MWPLLHYLRLPWADLLKAEFLEVCPEVLSQAHKSFSSTVLVPIWNPLGLLTVAVAPNHWAVLLEAVAKSLSLDILLDSVSLSDRSPDSCLLYLILL